MAHFMNCLHAVSIGNGLKLLVCITSALQVHIHIHIFVYKTLTKRNEIQWESRN